MEHRRSSELILFLLLFCGGCFAQAIAPPIAEFRGNKVDGMIEVQNGADYPMAAVVEVRSFEVDGKGEVHYRPLDKDIQVSLGANSFIVAPHDTHMVFYKALVPTAPRSFSIITTMTKAGPLTGVRLNFMLPHMIYIYQKEKLSKGDIHVEFSGGSVHIQNLSQKLGRVSGVQASKQGYGAFPIYPGQTREVPASGDKVVVSFEDGFKVSAK
jgi:hypothetical protein